MIVPLELNLLAMRRGYLSPELAMGWRIGQYVTEFFSDLEQVRIAAKDEGDAALGLSMMYRKNLLSSPVTIARAPRPWDFLAYHYPTGTTLQIDTVRDLVELPAEIRKLEALFEYGEAKAARPDRSSFAIRRYRIAVDDLIARLLSHPVEQYCQIRESRVRFLREATNRKNDPLHCRFCNRAFHKNEMVDFEGVICCAPCSGIEPAWLEWT